MRIYTDRLPNRSVRVFDDDRTISMDADAYGYEWVNPKVFNNRVEQIRVQFAVQTICALSERPNLAGWLGRDLYCCALFTGYGAGHVLEVAEPTVV